MPHSAVSNRQRHRAKSLRRTMRRAETLLWRHLKVDRLQCIGFRRQVPMKNYIADVISRSSRLVVELDGESHDFAARQSADTARDAWFQSQGLPRPLVCERRGFAKSRRRCASDRRSSKCTARCTPLPVPSPQGEREPSNGGLSKSDSNRRINLVGQ